MSLNQLLATHKKQILETLALEKKDMKTIHTFNVKANRKGIGVFPIGKFGKALHEHLKDSIFQNTQGVRKQNSIFSASKASPMLAIETPKDLDSDGLVQSKRNVCF